MVVIVIVVVVAVVVVVACCFFLLVFSESCRGLGFESVWGCCSSWV